MDTGRKTGGALALLLVVALAPSQAGCRRDARTDAGQQRAAAQPGATPQSGAAAPSAEEAARLDADIGRLEREAERNPADAETRDELARAYVRRGDARRGAGQLREALADYQSALRHDPDNDAAQSNAAAAAGQLGDAQQEDENGAPVPPPITPNVAGEQGAPAAAPTPKKQ